MNTTTIRVAKFAGAGLAGIATSCALAGPALAMRPDPIPGGGQNSGPTNSRVADQPVQDPSVKPAPPSRHDSDPQATTGATSDGIDWSTLATGLSGGVLLSGAVVVGGTQLRRRQTRAA